MNFWDLFNGSKFYKLRNQYRRDLFNGAKKVIEEYKLNVPLYDESFTRPLSDREMSELKKDREKLRGTIKAVDGYGSAAEVVFYDDSPFALALAPIGCVYIKKIGLKTLTDALAEIKARAETNYAMDLIDPAVIAGFVASYILGIVLACIPWTAALGLSIEAAAYGGLVLMIVGIIAYIMDLGGKGQANALEYELHTEQSANAYLSRSNAYMQSKKLDSGSSAIFSGLEMYANGSLYKSQSAGSESFCPTKAYNPSHKFASEFDTNNEALLKNDERTQGRAQYTLAGNEGYKDQINSKIPLSTIKELENDYAYKLNGLKQHNQRLLLGYGKLASFIGSTETITASSWLQAVYNADYRIYKDRYYDYVEGKVFLEEMKSYSKALRFKGEFYSRSNDERKWQKISQKIDVEDIVAGEMGSPSYESNPAQTYKDLITQSFYNKLLSEGNMEAYFEAKEEGLQEGSAEWLEAERDMLKALDSQKYYEYVKTMHDLESGGGNIDIDKAQAAIEGAMNESAVGEYYKAKGVMINAAEIGDIWVGTYKKRKGKDVILEVDMHLYYYMDKYKKIAPNEQYEIFIKNLLPYKDPYWMGYTIRQNQAIQKAYDLQNQKRIAEIERELG